MQKTSNHIKLGLFVATGTFLLVFALYLIGSKRNLFSKTFTIHALFKNVNGLMKGNNVRFAGINVGTIEEVTIINDSTVCVEMIVETDSRKFIRKDSHADIGSDGLMGNKLVNISSDNSVGAPVDGGDTIYSLKPIATDDMMRTLNTTNENVLDITNDLKRITKRINESNNIWKLLSDTTIAVNLQKAITRVESASHNAESMTADAKDLISDIKDGKGMMGKIMQDKAMEEDLKKTMDNLQVATDSARFAMYHMAQFMKDLNITPGPLGVLARDTVMATDMKSMIHNLNTSSATLEENLQALRSNFLFRKYFKKQAKAAKK